MNFSNLKQFFFSKKRVIFTKIVPKVVITQLYRNVRQKSLKILTSMKMLMTFHIKYFFVLFEFFLIKLTFDVFVPAFSDKGRKRLDKFISSICSTITSHSCIG